MSRAPEAAPRCYLHVPKCAGSSVFAALEAALGPAALAPRRFDDSTFAGFSDFDALPRELRRLIAVEAEELDELRSHPIICGHFALPTLLRMAPASSISIVIREPRARLLSLYGYWRTEDFSLWHPYVAHRYAEQPLERFLDEAELAPVIDNVLCRLLLRGDPLIPERGFIAGEAVPGLVERTLGRLAGLGFVGIQELPGQVWPGLSRFFGVPLTPVRVNVTAPAELSRRPWRCYATAATLDLLERRTAVERIVYRRVVEQLDHGPADAEQLATAAFVQQLAQAERLPFRRGGRRGPAGGRSRWRSPRRRSGTA